jgi:hypothetical protein
LLGRSPQFVGDDVRSRRLFNRVRRAETSAFRIQPLAFYQSDTSDGNRKCRMSRCDPDDIKAKSEKAETRHEWHKFSRSGREDFNHRWTQMDTDSETKAQKAGTRKTGNTKGTNTHQSGRRFLTTEAQRRTDGPSYRPPPAESKNQENYAKKTNRTKALPRSSRIDAPSNFPRKSGLSRAIKFSG